MEFGIDVGQVSRYGDHKPPNNYDNNYMEMAENSGFTAAWLGEHIASSSAFDLPWTEVFSTLSSFIGHTNNIEFGTGILIFPLRHPVLVAKSAATIQYLSGNRFNLGVGLGAVEEDYDALGIPYPERAKRFSEALELLNRIFTNETVNFSGEYYNVSDFTLEPMPEQPPRIIIAGSGIFKDGKRRVTKGLKKRITNSAPWIDGWMPPSTASVEMAKKDWSIISECISDGGGDVENMMKLGAERIHIVPEENSPSAREVQKNKFQQMYNDRPVEFGMNRHAVGSVDDIIEVLEKWEENDFDQLRILPSTRDLDELYDQIRLYEKYIL